MKQPIVIAVIALVIGVAIGFGVATLFDEPAPPVMMTSETKTSEKSQVAAEPEVRTREQPSRKETKAPTKEPKTPAPIKESAPETSDEPAPMTRAEVLAALPIYHVEEIEGVITGSVKNIDGTPAVAVLVRAEASLSSNRNYLSNYSSVREINDGSAPEIVDYPNRAQANLDKLYGLRAAYRREVLTDYEGKFRFEKLLDSAYSVQAYQKGFLALRPGRRDGRAKVGDDIHFTLTPIRFIDVSVLLPDGSEPDEAHVSIQAANSPYGREAYTRWTTQTRGIPYQDAVFRISARSTDGLMTSQTKSINTVGSNGQPSVTLQLEAATSLKIVLNYPEITLANVNHQVFVAETSLGVLDYAELRKQGREIREDRNLGMGSFIENEIDAGNYTLYITRLGAVAYTQSIALLEGQAADYSLDVPDLQPRDFVVVTIEGLSLEEQAQLTFRAGYQGGSGSGSSSATAVARPDGSFWVTRYSDSRATRVESYFVSARSATHGEVTASYSNSPDTRAHLKFLPPAVLEVSVEGYVAADDMQKQTSLRLVKAGQEETHGRGYARISGSDTLRLATALDDDGKLFITGISAGDYELQLFVGNNLYGTPALSMPINLIAGTNFTKIKIPANYELKIEFPADSNGSLTLMRGGKNVEYKRVSKNQTTISFGMLPEGEYRLEYNPNGQDKQAMIFRHNGPNPILFAPTE